MVVGGHGVTPGVTPGVTVQGIGQAFTTVVAANWHPLTMLSLMLDASLWGTGPRGFHAVNLALHAGSVLVLFVLLLTTTGTTWRSAIVAGLLAVHPMHVESVAWISQRKDVLSLFLGLLTLMAYASWSRRGTWWRYAIVMGLFGLALLSKPMMVSLPVLMLLMDFWPLRRVTTARSWLMLIAEKIPLGVMALGSCAMTMWAQRAGGAVNDISLRFRLMNVVVSYARYIGRLFWPVNLNVMEPLPGMGLRQPWEWGVVIGSAVLLAAITVAAWVARKRAPYVIVGWLWFVIALLPVIGIVSVGYQAMADRYAYLPYIGLYVAMVWGAGDVIERCIGSLSLRRAIAGGATVAACGVFVVLGLASRHQARYWIDAIASYERCLDIHPDNWVIHLYIAEPLMKAGRMKDAIGHLETAVSLHPKSIQCNLALGHACLEIDQPEQAMPAIERVLEIQPGNALARQLLGEARLRMYQKSGALP